MTDNIFDLIGRVERNSPFIFISEVNWFNAVSYIVNNKYPENQNIIDFYNNKNISINNDCCTEFIFDNLILSLNFYNSLKQLSSLGNNNNNTISIIALYYSIYHASRVLLSAINPTNTNLENHSKVRRCFFNDIATRELLPKPFSYTFSSILNHDIESQNDIYFSSYTSSSFNSNMAHTIENIDDAFLCFSQYMKGTAKYYQEDERKKLLPNIPFNDFRKTEAKRLRDEKYANRNLCFLDMMIRQRGKFNYRDGSVFSLTDRPLYNFFDSIININKFYLKSVFTYLSYRINKNKYDNFKEELISKCLLDINIEELFIR
ncbi:MAG: hypothetical protein PHI50_00125 [Alphaproteobacteria bacterium]|nr:hypothetical protein [Alphaproteobacteria bacterium]